MVDRLLVLITSEILRFAQDDTVVGWIEGLVDVVRFLTAASNSRFLASLGMTV